MGANETIIPSNLELSKLDQWFDQRFESKMAEREAAHTPSLAIIATKGTLDWAYPLLFWLPRPQLWAGTCRCFLPFTG